LQSVVSPLYYKKWHNRGMAHYAILRIQKLKSPVAVHRSLKHALREQDTPNADKERTPDNTELGASSVKEAMAAFRSRLPEKHRKDAVQCVEYLIAASPEAMKSKSRTAQDAYFSDVLDWLKAKHGAENVVFSGVHRDETTPHMYAYVVPRVGEKLNAKAFFGGAKALNALQTDFSQSVGVKHGFERGVERSKARHTSIRQYYARVADKTPEMPVIATLKPTIADRLDVKAYGDKVVNDVISQVNPSFAALKTKESELDGLKKQVETLRQRVELDNKKFSQARHALDRMNPEFRAQAIEMLGVMRQKSDDRAMDDFLKKRREAEGAKDLANRAAEAAQKRKDDELASRLANLAKQGQDRGR
jgi:aromatic ring-cleaving dioxygenase